MTTLHSQGPAGTIRIQDLRLVHNAGNLKAFARISYGETTVNDVRIIQQPGQQAWVSPPQREFEKDGKRQWVSVVRWERELADAIQTAVLAAYEKALRDGEEWLS